MADSDPKADVLPGAMLVGEQSEAALQMTKHAIDRCKTAISWVRSDGRLIYANEAARQQLGYSELEMLSMSVFDFDPDWSADYWATGWQRVKEAGVMTFESRNRHKDGHLFPVEITTNYIVQNGDEYVFAFVTDITDRKRAEQALRDSETKLRAIFDHHYQLTGLLDCEGRLLAGNKTALDFAGVDGSEVIGRCFWETPWWDPSQETILRHAIQRAARGEFVRFESTHVRADGQIRDFDFSLSPVEDDQGKVIYLVPEGRDITDFKQAELRLRENDAMIRSLVETSRDWIWAIDLDGIHTYCNPAVEAILGYRADELSGASYFDLIHEDDRQQCQTALSAGAFERSGWSGLVLRWRHKDGSWRYLESNAVPIVGGKGELLGFRGVDRDVTARFEADQKLSMMESQLAHAGRLSAMGEMTAGIVHEVAQPLFTISNFAHAAENVLDNSAEPDLSDLKKWVAGINSSIKRADEIIRRMRTFARRSESKRSICRINEIVGESVQLVAVDARSVGVKVHQILPEPSLSVKVDRVQIQQVVVNLLRNAFEAMRETERRERDVTIRVEPAGQSICVSVTDTGPGLTLADSQGNFEPFATTKENGLGLGLAISKSIIETHGGELSAESAAAGGAVFRVKLPALQEEPGDGD
jgi:PAS domain S-box-containing protein